MATEYTQAPESIMELVRTTVEECHPQLDGIRLAVVMKEKATTRNHKKVLATTGKPSARMKPLLRESYHYVMVIAEDEWHELTMDQRKALIDHELCHCGFDDDGEPSIFGHDLEEFGAVIERHGLWRGDAGERAIQEPLIRMGVTVGTITSDKQREGAQ